MFIPQAFAQTAGSGAAVSPFAGIAGFLPLILVFIAFYFLMIRPQQRRVKELQSAVHAVKKGDTVTTAGGIVGKVTRVEDLHVEVEIAPSTRVRVVKATLADVTPLGSGKPAND